VSVFKALHCFDLVEDDYESNHKEGKSSDRDARKSPVKNMHKEHNKAQMENSRYYQRIELNFSVRLVLSELGRSHHVYVTVDTGHYNPNTPGSVI
jgi:hypothetical protein